MREVEKIVDRPVEVVKFIDREVPIYKTKIEYVEVEKFIPSGA